MNFIDLFSGCGGVSHGLEQAGLKCILAVDENKDAIKTFELNHPNTRTITGDIRRVTDADFLSAVNGKKVDVIVGGPPCQGFSTAGKGLVDDPRNFLLLEYARVVRLFKPKHFILENVPAMLSPKNEKLVDQIRAMFKFMGYRLQSKVLFAENYGVPQKRRRAFIVGSLPGCNFSFPEETHGNSLLPVKTLGEAFNEISPLAPNNDLRDARITNERTLAQIRYIPEGGGIRKKEDEDRLLPDNLKLGADWSNLKENRLRQLRLQRLSRDAPAFTLMTSRLTYYHPTEDRYLTPREAAKLQSFPDSFEFLGSKTSIFKQIGNAVPVRLGEALGRSLLDSVNHVSLNEVA